MAGTNDLWPEQSKKVLQLKLAAGTSTEPFSTSEGIGREAPTRCLADRGSTLWSDFSQSPSRTHQRSGRIQSPSADPGDLRSCLWGRKKRRLPENRTVVSQGPLSWTTASLRHDFSVLSEQPIGKPSENSDTSRQASPSGYLDPPGN